MADLELTINADDSIAIRATVIARALEAGEDAAVVQTIEDILTAYAQLEKLKVSGTTAVEVNWSTPTDDPFDVNQGFVIPIREAST